MEGILGSMARTVSDLLLLENTRPQPTTFYQSKTVILFPLWRQRECRNTQDASVTW